MKSELVPIDGGPAIPITRDVTVLGRREFCDVEIRDESLSSRHAVIVRTDGLLMIRDLASTNGTKVNGQRVMWAALLPNDRLTLGRVKFKIYLGSDEVPSPSEKTGRRKPAAAIDKPSIDLTPRRAAPAIAEPQFPPPTPSAVPLFSSTNADSDLDEVGEFLMDDDEDEAFIIDLD